jgi:ankyrin repeat protein
MRIGHLAKLGVLVAAVSLAACGDDPLLRAARTDNLTHVQQLIEKGGTAIDAQDSTGHSALMAAAAHGRQKVVEYLVAKGADVNLSNKSGWTPLVYAVSLQHFETARFLIEHGADINARFTYFQEGERTLLMQAVSSFDRDSRDKAQEIIKTLLDRGAEVNRQDAKGKSALMMAVMKKHADIVRLLLAHGADVSLRDSDGKSALDLARDLALAEVVSQIEAAAKKS